jgi:RNA polymerase sigma-70 factor (ECF subfamily)
MTLWPCLPAGGAVPIPGGLAALLLAGAAAEPRDAAADLADVRGALQGDGEAYARIVRRHQRGVTARLWRFTRERGALEELVHRTFVEAWLGLRGFRGEAPFEHWLHRIAVRTGYGHWRERREDRERRGAHLPGAIDLAAAPPDPAQAGAILHDLLGRLPPRDRLVLTLMAIEGHSVAETAALTGWSRPLVKVQAHRARAKLRRLIGEPAGGFQP